MLWILLLLLVSSPCFAMKCCFVVLGCSLSILEGRVVAASQAASSDDIVVFTGSFGEAELAKGVFLRNWGRAHVPLMLLDTNSTTTLENAVCTQRLLDEHQPAFHELLL
jgi:hypothetical protein